MWRGNTVFCSKIASNSMVSLRNTFGARIIIRPLWPNLNPCYYYLRRCFKGGTYTKDYLKRYHQEHIIGNLKTYIQTILNVISCVQHVNLGHFQHLL